MQADIEANPSYRVTLVLNEYEMEALQNILRGRPFSVSEREVSNVALKQIFKALYNEEFMLDVSYLRHLDVKTAKILDNYARNHEISTVTELYHKLFTTQFEVRCPGCSMFTASIRTIPLGSLRPAEPPGQTRICKRCRGQVDGPGISAEYADGQARITRNYHMACWVAEAPAANDTTPQG